MENPTPTHSPTPNDDEQMVKSVAIPGAFVSDGTDDELDGAVTAIGSPKPAASSPTTPMRNDEIEVKWNQETDIISPKVRGERHRIEKLVQEQRERSRSPPDIPVSCRVRKTSSLFSAPGETEQRPDSDVAYDSAIEETDVGVGVATKQATPRSPEERSPSPVAVEESQELPKVTAIPGVGECDASAVARKYEPANAAEGIVEQKAESEATAEEKGDDASKEKDDGFGGDDFDDFGETVEADGDGFNDFDDFEGFQDGDADGPFDGPAPVPEAVPPPPPPTPPQPVIPQLPARLPDFGDREGVRFALADAVEKMFPTEGTEQRKPTCVEGRSFLTDRR